MYKVFLALLLLFSLGSGVSAQAKNGVVSTTAVDEKKVVVRGTVVTLTNVGTKAVQKCVSNDKGECRFEVPAGAYELTTDATDRFCPLKISDIGLKENETVPVELKLEPFVEVEEVFQTPPR